jgi:hypothetical protein
MTELDKHNFWVAIEAQKVLELVPSKEGFYIIEEVIKSNDESWLAEICFKEPKPAPAKERVIPEMGSMDSYEVGDFAEVEIKLISREEAWRISDDNYELIGLKFAPSTGVRPVIKKK